MTGLPTLDRMLFGDEYYRGEMSAGFRNGEVVLIRGEPGSGKTTLGLQIASNFLRSRQNHLEGVRFLTLEEPWEAMERRCEKYGFARGDFTPIEREEIDGIVQDFCRITNPRKVVAKPAKLIGAVVRHSAKHLGVVGGVVAKAAAPTIEQLVKLIFARMIKPLKRGQRFNDEPRLIVIDSLNALMNLLIKADPEGRPRLVFNSFCQVLRSYFAPRQGRQRTNDGTNARAEAPVIMIIGEHHFHEPDTDKHLPESFFCDTEIVLRPEPVRVPRDSDAAAKMTLGYDLAAIVDRDARHLESRSFCRVLKARNSPRQSRRCAYDIEAGQGFRFFETYPGDGKLMLFGENEQQRASWNSFFHRDLTDAYPALRYETFTMAGLETVYESSRRLLQVPLRTDMFLSSLDSYWVTGYRDYRLKTKINERLQARMKGVRAWTLSDVDGRPNERGNGGPEARPRRSPISAWACLDYPSLVNELVYYALCRLQREIYAASIEELSMRPRPVRDARSQRFQKRIEDLQSDSLSLKSKIDKLTEGLRQRYDGLCGYLFGVKIDEVLADPEVIPRGHLQETFLRPLPRSQLTLFGQYNADLLPPLVREEMHQFDKGEDYWLSIPYDANIGVFVARMDRLRPALLDAGVKAEYVNQYKILKRQEIKVLNAAHDKASLLVGSSDESAVAAFRARIDEAVAVCKREEEEGPGELPSIHALAVTREARLTWDQVISLSAALKLPFAVETRSFDTLTAFFLELIWNCGGKLEVNGCYLVDDKEKNALPLLRAMHIFAGIFKFTGTERDQTIDPSQFHSGPGGLSDYGDWLFGRYWYSTLVDALTATRSTTRAAPFGAPSGAGDAGQREFVWQPTVESERVDVEILRMPRGRGDFVQHYACWGDWSFGLLHGSENVALACDLISNLMGALKVTERGLRGACLPTVSQFYWRYRDEPCVPATIRTDIVLPRMTFGEIGSAYLGTPAGARGRKSRDGAGAKGDKTDDMALGSGIFRQSIFDYRHCAREIFGELLSIKRDIGKELPEKCSPRPNIDATKDHVLVVDACVNILRGIEENRRRYIFIRDSFRHDVADLTLQGADRRQDWCEKLPACPASLCWTSTRTSMAAGRRCSTFRAAVARSSIRSRARWEARSRSCSATGQSTASLPGAR